MNRRRGFTLVELSVVIGIMMVLLALLAGAFNRARTLASRAVCQNNLRQVGVLFTVYAGRYADQVPIGSSYRPQVNFEMAYYQTPPDKPWYLLCGCLYAAGLIQNPHILYEPDLDDDDHGGFNTPGNPWPPGSAYDSWGETGETVCDYSSRVWPGLSWLPNRIVGQLPRLSQLANTAVFADWNFGNGALDQRHVTGINVLYGDGGIQWVDRALIQKDLDAQDAENWMIDLGYTQDLWSLLDAAHQ